MLIPHHREILQEALQNKISPRVLKVITKANIRQDYLHGQSTDETRSNKEIRPCLHKPFIPEGHI